MCCLFCAVVACVYFLLNIGDKPVYGSVFRECPTVNRAVSSLNPLNTKRGLLYIKTQFVPRSKHFSSRL